MTSIVGNSQMMYSARNGAFLFVLEIGTVPITRKADFRAHRKEKVRGVIAE
jgi:hypothetical protein